MAKSMHVGLQGGLPSQARFPDYAAIAGGVGDIKIDTIVHGGEAVVVGGVAKVAARDRMLMLKHAPDDMRELLAIIGMNMPISFGNVAYDDGARSKKLGALGPEGTVMAQLRARLALGADKVAETWIRDYKLMEPTIIALVDLIRLLAAHLKKHAPEPRPVTGPGGEILARLEDGADYFTLVADRDDAKKVQASASLAAIARDLLTTMATMKCNVSANAAMANAPALRRPNWPSAPVALEDPKDESEPCTTVRACVEAIVMREHALMAHIDEIEHYYVDTAHDIATLAHALAQQFEACA